MKQNHEGVAGDRGPNPYGVVRKRAKYYFEEGANNTDENEVGGVKRN